MPPHDAYRAEWSAPHVEPAAKEEECKPSEYSRDVHFELLEREPGRSLRSAGAPIWRSTDSIVAFSDRFGPVQRADVPEVPGAFVLSNVLTNKECQQLRQLSEAMGYRVEPPMGAGVNSKPDRRNCNCIWIADDSLWQPIWRRIAPYMPADDDGSSSLGLNHRLRFYRYQADDDFGMRPRYELRTHSTCRIHSSLTHPLVHPYLPHPLFLRTRPVPCSRVATTLHSHARGWLLGRVWT